jgi:hypothetical protein
VFEDSNCGCSDDGVLKWTAYAAFSWQEIMMGKAKKEAASVFEQWKDRDVLKRLEWTYVLGKLQQ